MMLVRTRVAPSKIHGLGLFAVEFISQGRPIWRFQAGFDHDFSPEQFAALPAPACEHARWFAFTDQVTGHVVLSGDHACFMNHSARPNTGVPPNTPPPVTTVALRDIAAGEEITCDYFAFDADAPRKLGSAAAEAPQGAPPS
jgi:SET domain-containing protein